MASFLHEIMPGADGIMSMKVWRGPAWPVNPDYYRTKKQIHPRANQRIFWSNINDMLCVDHVPKIGKRQDLVLRVADPTEDGLGICRRCAKSTDCPLEQLAVKKWASEQVSPRQMRMFSEE